MVLRLSCLTVLLLATVPQGKGEKRSLSEIRYHFTPCGKTGRVGPSYQECVDYYTSISSPIISDHVLTDTHSSVFIGSQSFQAPRATVYNVTIAGAAGGRGLCNSEYGKGLVQNTSLIPPNTTFDYIILVGQRGLGPCETGEPDPGHMLCQNPPQNLEESANCSEAYQQWLQTLGSMSADSTFTFSGGAGGGGASFIGIRDSRNFGDVRTRAVSGGGGGSSSLLDYSVIRDLLPQLSTSSENDSVLYTEQMNARPSIMETLISHPEGVRGYKIESAVVTAGAGGGISGSLEYPISQEDGKLIGLTENFAVGGTHCARNDFSGIPGQLREADGGFGGGGGGCGGGGGGGGYTGGSVIGDTNTAPGGGGHVLAVYFLNNYAIFLPPGTYTYNIEGDGYVDVVAADCGCVYECVVYEEEDQFECLCPNNTQLAPDLSDCYYSEERDIVMIKFESVSTSDIKFRGITFGNSTFIFSVDIYLRTSESQQIHRSTSEDDRCVLMFLGGDNNIVLATNPVIGSGTAANLSEVSLNLTSGTLTMTDYTSFLNSSVPVTGAVLASNGDCVIGDIVTLNISTQENDNEVNFTEVMGKLFNNSNVVDILVSQLLQLPTPSTSTVVEPTDTPSADETNGFASGIVALIVIGVLLIALVIFSLVTIGVLFLSRRRRLGKAWKRELQDQGGGGLNNTEEGGRRHFANRELDAELIPQNFIRLLNSIGEGEFGLVYKAHLVKINTENPFHTTAETQTVAVKTLKGFHDHERAHALLDEARRMKNLDHPNILTLIGVCMSDNGTPSIVMPFMAHGNLLVHLRRTNNVFVESHSQGLVQDASRRLLGWCLQIAQGMEYLSAKKIVHRDLAARNCMLDENMAVKVADFGFSEKLYTTVYTRMVLDGTVKLPVKWMAPESIAHGVFSEKSDVWSFGVTCWEIFTGGVMPYAGIHSSEIPKMQDHQRILDRPNNQACFDDMYGIMLDCWESSTDDRPTFSQLVAVLTTHLETLAGGYLKLVST